MALAVTLYGVLALTFMMSMYALEARGARFVLGFCAGCLLSSVYGFLSGAWPFGVVEAVWAVVAFRRYQGYTRRPAAPPRPSLTSALRLRSPPSSADREEP